MSELSATLAGADLIAINLAEMNTVIRQHILATLRDEGERLVQIVRDEKLEGQVLKRRTTIGF